jgi:hypothetical protein
MLLRELICDGRPAFPPSWQDPQTGVEPLRDDRLAGVLVEVEWGPHNLSLKLTNYWRGRRLSGRLLTDDATVLPRVHALLSASIPRHLDELVDMELPPPEPRIPAPSARPPAESPPRAAQDDRNTRQRSAGPALHPDVALLVATLVRKGVLTFDDIEATRRGNADEPVSRPLPASALAAHLERPDAGESADSPMVRLTPRK